MTDKTPLLTVENLSVDYLGEKVVHAVKGRQPDRGRGEIIGLAGESGCGKSTFAYGINQLLRPPAMITGGEVILHDRSGPDVDVLSLKGKDLRTYRGQGVDGLPGSDELAQSGHLDPVPARRCLRHPPARHEQE